MAVSGQALSPAVNATRSRRRPSRPAVAGSTELHDTRQRILAAAREVFARYGYVDASIEHIVTLCHVSRGTFYYYFKNKEDVFEQLVHALNQRMEEARVVSATTDPYLRIEAGNRAYLEMWAEHRDIMANLFQIATIDPRFEEIHRAIRMRFISRIQRHLERELAASNCRALDPVVAAHALGGMVDWFAYRWFGKQSIGIEHAELKHVVSELSELWYHALYGGRPHEGGTHGEAP